MMRYTLGAGLALVAVAAGAGGDHPQAPPPRTIPISGLVKQLGSEDFKEREEATLRLSDLTLEPPVELIAATRSANSEVATRSKRAVSAIQARLMEARLARGRRFAELGKIDLFVAATAAWDLPPDDSRLWVPVQDLGRRLIEKARMTGDRKPHNCPSSFSDFATYSKLCGPLFTRSDVPYIQPDPMKENPPVVYHNRAIQAPDVASPVGGLFGGLIVSRGGVNTRFAIQESVIFANGDITSAMIGDSVLVCDGDLIVTKRGIDHGIVIARGNITVEGTANPSFLAAGGKITQTKAVQKYNFILENTTNAIGVTFFELATVGVDVKTVDGSVTISTVANKKPFAMEGIRVGDVIISVDGKKPASAESLRRLLRDSLALGDAAITLRRGEDTLSVKIALPE